MMSKANLLINKRTPVVNISNKQKTPGQYTITHRQTLKEDDSQKLYTFCSSQQKQTGHHHQEESREISRQRKISFNNVRGKVYQPLSKSKGKTVSQVNIHKERKKQLSSYSIANNTSAILNNSALNQRRKTDKITARQERKDKEDKKINISINLSRNGFNEPANKENHLQLNTLFQEKLNFEKKILSQANFNKQKDLFNQSGKKMIMMSEQELQNFTKKQATDKVRLQQQIQKLSENLQIFEDKQTEWKNFKKDSQDYIKYLVKQKQAVLSHYQVLKNQVDVLNSDKEYHQMAKEQYRCTIHEQQTQIHQLKRELSDAKEQIKRLHDQLEKQVPEKHNQINSVELQMLEIENFHLKKELQINQKQQSIRTSHQFDIQNLQKQLNDLKAANQFLSSQIKEMYIYKLKCDVLEKTVEQQSKTIAKLTQQNQSLKSKHREKSKTTRLGDKSSDLSEFEFRLDTSPHSPSEVEVVWKRDYDEEKESFPRSHVQDYFDHDFFSSFNKQKL